MKGDPREVVASLLWSANQGYLNPIDRKLNDEFIASMSQHPDDRAELPHWLSMADEVLAAIRECGVSGVDDYVLSQTAAGHKLSLRECVRKGNPLAAFDEFIMAWVDPKWHAHLMDNDDNDAERVRDAIRDAWQFERRQADETVGPLDEYLGQ